MENIENKELEIEIITENESEIESSAPLDREESENDDEDRGRYKDGELLTLVRVRFPGNARSFPFLIGKRKFHYGQKVVAMSDRGMTVGYVNSIPYEIPFNKGMLPLRSISKVATEDDIKAQKDFRDSEKKAEVICLRLIEKYNLDMVLTHVEFIQFGKKAVFYFNAPERVDFRELVKDLVYDLKMRIELRQISVRDRAAALGAVGSCGLQTCCSSFLKNYGNVSIKMAKNQNLALIPSKLNGVCGQIKCCIKFEDDVYADKRANLPKEQAIIKVKNGDIGKVLKLHLLIEQFEMLTSNGAKRRYAVNQFNPELALPENYRFPETFEHIVDETKEVIGLIKAEKLVSDRFMKEMEELKESDNSGQEDEDDDDFEFHDNLNKDMGKIQNELAQIEKETVAPQKNHNQPPRHHNHSNNQNRPKHGPGNKNRHHQNRRPNHNQGNQGGQSNHSNNTQNKKPRQ